MKQLGKTNNYIHSCKHKIVMLVCIMLLPIGYISAQTIKLGDDKNDYTKQIKTLFDKNEWQAGKKIVDQNIDKYPNDSDLRMLSGRYSLYYKQYDEARYQLNKALQLNVDNSSAKELLVKVETESGRYSSAICFINELLEINPYNADLWHKKIALYDRQGNYVDANRLRMRMNTIYPNDSIIQRDLVYNLELEATIKRKDGRVDQAIALSKELVQQQPDNAELYFELINDYTNIGDQYTALTYIERAMNRFPNNTAFRDKKIGILADQKRYSELLTFLQQQQKKNNSTVLQQQYNYYLREAAQNAQDNEPATLYGKILERNPTDEDAFAYVFTNYMTNRQYEEALGIINKYKKIKGESKALSIRELMVYNGMGNTARAASLTKQLVAQYPQDTSLRDGYATLMLQEGKDRMLEGRYPEAVASLNSAKQYGDSEVVKVANNSLYNAYRAMGDYANALNILDLMKETEPADAELFVKKADIYLQQARYQMALVAYEQAINMADKDQRLRHIGGYGDMLTRIIKELNEQFRYDESMQYVKRWLQYDAQNRQALQYAVNISASRNNAQDVLMYANKGHEIFADDVFFNIKLAEANGAKSELYAQTYQSVHNDLIKNPYHKELINAFAQLAVNYGNQLIKNKESQQAFLVVDTALHYAPANKDVKYVKGLVFQLIHQFDSAYYYQSFYQPSDMEKNDFKQHLNYLKYKSYRHEVGLSYMSSRFGDNNQNISSIATVEYSRYAGINTYTARLNYAGRDLGKGYQLQAEWGKEWSSRTRTRIDGAVANQFFPSLMLNASIYRDLRMLGGVEGELGVGYRNMDTNQQLLNAVVGLTKEVDAWRINGRLNNFILGSEWLYSLSGNVRYYLSSPKNYLTAVASIGTSPDVDIINYQFYNGFSVTNTMIGGGAGYLFTKTISAGVLGTWYNYKSNDTTYRNLYTLNLNVNVAF